MTWTDERKLQQLLETGSLENIELAFAIAESNQINLNLERYEALYQWLWEREWLYEAKGIPSYDEDLSQKIFRLFSIKNLHLHKQEVEQELDFLTNLVRLQNLEKLHLQHNNLTSIPIEICQLEQVFYLNLRSNLFEALPDYFAKMKDLERLWLGQNKFKNVPQVIFQLTKLKTLSLEYSKIQDISGDWECLEILEELLLCNNEISSLPSNLSLLKNIKKLDFSYNQVESFPANFFDLQSLVQLNGSNNKIAEIPSDILKMTSLEVLTFRNNALTTIPDELFDLPKLKTLDLSNNQFPKKERKRIKELWSNKSVQHLFY